MFAAAFAKCCAVPQAPAASVYSILQHVAACTSVSRLLCVLICCGVSVQILSIMQAHMVRATM